MNTTDTQRMAKFRRMVGIDTLHDLVAKSVHDLNVITRPIMEQMQHDDRFSLAAHERLQHFDHLCAEGKLVDAYHYGHAALKSAQASVQHVQALQTELVDAIHDSVAASEAQIDTQRQQITNDIQALPTDLYQALGKEAIEADVLLYRNEMRATNELLSLTDGVYEAARIDNLKHDLFGIEQKAEEDGISLLNPGDIEPLAPLPPINAHAPPHAGQAPPAPARTTQQSPSL